MANFQIFKYQPRFTWNDDQQMDGKRMKKDA